MLRHLLRANRLSGTKRSRTVRRQSLLEPLEDRTLLNGNVMASVDINSVLNVLGDQYNNNFAMVENANGTVTVQGSTGALATSINHSTSAYTTPVGVHLQKIMVDWAPGYNGAETLSVSGKPTTGTIPTLSIVAGNGVNDSFSVSNTAGTALTIQSGSGDSTKISVSNSTFSGAANISDAGGKNDSIVISGDKFGPTSVSQGSGSGAYMSLANSTLSSTVLSQGWGSGDSIKVDTVSAFDMGIYQGPPPPTAIQPAVAGSNLFAGDQISVHALTLNGYGKGLTINQGCTSAVTPLFQLWGPDVITVDTITAPSVTIAQGSSYQGAVTVTNFTVKYGVSVSQGDGAMSQASVTNGTAASIAVSRVAAIWTPPRWRMLSSRVGSPSLRTAAAGTSPPSTPSRPGRSPSPRPAAIATQFKSRMSPSPATSAFLRATATPTWSSSIPWSRPTTSISR